MFNTKIISATIILGSVMLAGCSDAKFMKTQAEVATLNKKVDNLSMDVQALKVDVTDAKAEAARANQRLDNQVATYRK